MKELLTESGVYGSGSTTALLKGKSYNRGVRAHKITMEALLRLQWLAFSKWLKERDQETQLQLVDEAKI